MVTKSQKLRVLRRISPLTQNPISTQMMTRIIIDVAKIRNYFEPMNRRAKFMNGFRNM